MKPKKTEHEKQMDRWKARRELWASLVNERGWTQAQVARKYGVSRMSVWKALQKEADDAS